MHVISTVKKLIPCFLLFVTTISPIFSQSIKLEHFPELSIVTQLNKDTRYEPKIQAEESFLYGFSVQFFDYFGIGAAMRVFNVHASDLTGGFQYRGYLGWGPQLRLFGRIPLQNNGNTGGVSGTISTALLGFIYFTPQFARYNLIDRSFFYLALQTGAALEIVPPNVVNWSLRVGIPVYINFRQDLEYSLAVGLSVTFIHRIIETSDDQN